MDLGLERAGMECKWQVESNEWCRKILRKHWKTTRLISSVEAFLASPSRKLENSKPVTVRGGCGLNSSVPFACFAQDSLSLKMLKTSDELGLHEYSMTLPASGMMRNGILYPLAPSVPDTFVSVCSSLRPPEFWQTLRSSRRGIWADHRQRSNGGQDLESQIAKMGGSGPMNPEWAEEFMGFDVGWTALED